MHMEKELKMEDTWKTRDLEKHLRGGVYDEDNIRKKDRRRRDEDGRKGRSGESVERRHRDRDSEAYRERDKYRERDSTRERTKHRDSDKDRDHDRRREGTRERTMDSGERDRERRRERERAGDSSRDWDIDRGSRDRRHERAEKENRDREREREREKRRAERDQERGTDRDRRREEGREGERERDRERAREREKDRDREKERDYERRRDKDRHREREQGHSSKHLKETDRYNDGLREEYLESKREKERRERHSDREYYRQKEDKEYREHRRREKEERERRHREREEHHPGESRRHDGKPQDSEREHRHREHKESEHHLSGEVESRERRSHSKPRERRHREEGDLENGPAEVTSANILRLGRDREGRETKEKKVENEEDETEKPAAEDHRDEEGADDYEEDFEDYEEDFEELDESDGAGDDKEDGAEEEKKEEELSPQKRREIEEIRRAMDAENERVGSGERWRGVEEVEVSKRDHVHRAHSGVSPSKSIQHGKFIDFVAAKQREVSKKASSKQKKRSAELLRLIDLDFSVSFSLLDLPPVNEYDMYIKNFGTTNTKQAYVQCNEDNTDRETQTEEIEESDKWTQHPGDSNVVCGGPKLTNEASVESMTKMSFDSQRLAAFLHSASQVVAVLLEEDRAEKHSLRQLKSQVDSLSFSDGCLELNTKLPFLHGREVSLISFSQVQRQTMLSVHSPTIKPSAVRLDSQTILCIWNIWEPSCPQKVLVYESEVLCCCFSPGKATLVFAGTAVGSVVVWDLREHSSLHYTLKIGDHDWTLRYPTFSTDAVLAASSHFSSVRSVEPVPANVTEGLRPEFSLLPAHEGVSGLSFQLASLDESGVLNLWVVVELPKANQAGSQTDLGLKPGGKVKLLHSSSITTNERLSKREAVKTVPLRALLLKFLPSDSNHFFIGTDMGVVTHGTRHGLNIPPKFYRPQLAGLRPVHVTSVDISPFGEPVFLVGCADGSVRMHSLRKEQPLMEWTGSTNGEPVVSVQWALTRPAMFCVLDAASNIHIWDLLEKDYEPMTTEKIRSDRVTAMAVFGDPAKQNTFSGISLAVQSGKIEMQYFNKKWAVPTPAELENLQNMLHEAF